MEWKQTFRKQLIGPFLNKIQLNSEELMYKTLI